MPVHSIVEARLRARIAAHTRRLFVEGRYRSVKVFADRLGIDHAQTWRVLTGERTPGLLFLIAMRGQLGADLNVVLIRDPPRRWFRPLARRPGAEWQP